VATTATELTIRVAEVFCSIQGEGVSLGLPSVFVRLQGCSVGCTWCDTKYSWNPRKGRALTLAALVDQVRAASPENVVVTRGASRLSIRRLPRWSSRCRIVSDELCSWR
jgi:uncharacterized Zn-finger protein